MDRLKQVLADKILDLTSSGANDVKEKIDKMHRFRDFANACQTLMNKYPLIEEELIKMINDGDFDTKVASSRVDSVICLTDSAAGRMPLNQDKEPEIAEVEPSSILSEDTVVDKDETSVRLEEEFPVTASEFVSEIVEKELPVIETAPELPLLPEDIEYEEIVSDREEDDNKDKEYVSYQELDDTNIEQPEENRKTQVEIEKEIPLSQEEIKSANRKANIYKGLHIAAILVAVALLIAFIKLVMVYWQTILIMLGGVLIILVAVWVLKKKIK